MFKRCFSKKTLFFCRFLCRTGGVKVDHMFKRCLGEVDHMFKRSLNVKTYTKRLLSAGRSLPKKKVDHMFKRGRSYV